MGSIADDRSPQPYRQLWTESGIAGAA